VSVKFTLKIIFFVAVVAILPVHATLITESGAGALIGTAQDLTGTTPTEIVGTLPNVTDALLDVNLFKFNIDDFLDFSVVSLSVPHGVSDTELFLFDSTGHGVYANDDMGGGDPVTFSLACLPSALNNPCLSALPSGIGPTSNGVYYLAITRSSDMPLSDLGEIFTLINSTDVVGPDLTMGGADSLAGWDGGGFTDPNSDAINYDIVLTGTTVPEPASWSMVSIAGLCLVLMRVKFNRR
jgi:hypothetical protein